MAKGDAAIIQQARAAGAAELREKQKEGLIKQQLEQGKKAISRLRSDLARKENTVNTAHLTAQTVGVVAGAPLGFLFQQGLQNWTANSVVLDANSPTGYSNTLTRRFATHILPPILGIVVAIGLGVVLKKHVMFAAVAVGAGVGIAVGSILRSIFVGVPALPPAQA